MQTKTKLVSLGDFPDTPEIKRQARYAEHMKERLAQAEKALAAMVERFREVCGEEGHDFESVIQRYDNYQPKKEQEKGQDVFAGKRCKKCKLFLARPKGCPWEVCYKCGGVMKALDNLPESLYFLHKCQDCGHEYESLVEL